MCSISGFINLSHPTPLKDYYPAHLRLRHRGQDDEGFWAFSDSDQNFCRGDDTISNFDTLPHIQTITSANVVLGHRRLSIIDLSANGHQPMQSRCSRYVMVYNGEIYNYLELRSELESLGHRFTTQSDSEVLLAAFSQWEMKCFNRFNGMWAVAIYDKLQRRLILCRDRFGIKPLYYSQIGSTLYFASEAKFLIPFLPQLQMNEARVIEYLAQNLVDHHPETMFENIFQLMPAHYAIYSEQGLQIERYWQLSEMQIQISLDDAVEQLQELLTSAIDLRLRSDVPLGSLLSGGLDSTTIVCLVRDLLDGKGAKNAFEFFSAVFKEEEYSERCYIEDTIAQTQMPVHWVYPQPNQLEETLPDLLYHQEFPFRSLAVYSQWSIMQTVAQTPIKVLLNGQGSDEIFGGYTAHYFTLIAHYIQRFKFSQAWSETKKSSQSRQLSSLRIIASAINALFKISPARSLRNYRNINYLNERYQVDSNWDSYSDIFFDSLARNLTYSALPEYLRYEDRNSMAFTLESRLPFLDYRLVEWAMSLPAHLKIQGEASKQVLRTMAGPIIPKSVANRRDKMGFISPQFEWQHHELKNAFDTVFTEDLQMLFPFLDGKKLNSMYEKYQSTEQHNITLGTIMWRIFCLNKWHREWWHK